MQSVLIVVHLIIVMALAVTVLLQRSEGGGLGLGGGGGPSGMFTGRGQANLLTRTTAILGAAFFATSLVLSILAARTTGTGSPLDQIIPVTTSPTAPAAPGGPGQTQGQGVLDQLRGLQQNQQTPAGPAPAAPAPVNPAPAAPVPTAPAPEAPK